MFANSFSINPTLSPLSSSTTSTSSSSCNSRIVLIYPCFGTSRSQPICLLTKKIQSLEFNRPSISVERLRYSKRKKPFLLRSKMTNTEIREDGEEENPPPYFESDITSRPRRIALFVEPSPFAYVSGYKNRFQNFIKYLREMGDEVMVVTTHEGVPEEFHGAQLIGSHSFPCPWYQKVPLSLALSPRIISKVSEFKPDIIHASSPGIMVFGALFIAKLLCVPIVMSYHTHVPVYIPRYTFSWLVQPMWWVIKFLHRAADLTLVPSAAIAKDLQTARVTAANKIRLWNKGVDSDSFNPKYRSHEMRIRLSNGEPEKPLIVHVGRLGVEKSLDFVKRVMDRLPGARIAFIGDGPYRAELEELFSGMPAVFTGMLQGEELSQAYASGDVFIMPSESETLGLVVLEAMSSGLPVVAARAGGIPDIIPDDQQGKTGYLFNPGDLEDCLSKLEPLLSNRVLRETIGKAAREEMEKYDWKAATAKIRNEQYNAAIWFWQKSRAQLLSPLQWLTSIFQSQSPDLKYSCGYRNGVRRTAPAAGSYTHNVDASVVPGASSFCIDMILRDDMRRSVGGKIMRLNGMISALEAEAMGVNEALSWIHSIQISNIIIGSDFFFNPLIQISNIIIGSDFLFTIKTLRYSNQLEVGNVIDKCSTTLQAKYE